MELNAEPSHVYIKYKVTLLEDIFYIFTLYGNSFGITKNERKKKKQLDHKQWCNTIVRTFL